MDQPFEVAVRDHGAVVLRVCRAVLGPGADAEDAWSETFVSALRAWPELDPAADVRAWLVTIAHRRAIDAVRARGRRAVPVAEPPERERGDGARGDGEPELPDEELWSALRSLPDKQRRCVAYHHLAGLPHAEVAALVGGTPEAARRASADGIAALRRAMARAGRSRA
ncbi:sigma-70 family RNA polymerase sigma factor [Auraticoccus sp. F435]|uniref:Sigma-70 family RNA polymerase sigma factor n=1 Tax=Auraticoccus cholistanensis TaxID=2656650 RepID=A0A6A9URF6_9ACTN|nr:sigma-70 family RNA polymerase sigma factor [Auraticoccus cholistanensis]MVA75251.1 sigma-70 family RNA polymerase sigma factor [Auraticoccus cholistanensis]